MAIFNITGVNLQPMQGSYEEVAVSTTAVSLSASKYKVSTVHNSSVVSHTVQNTWAEQAFITVVSNAIRWTVDGTTPTAGATGTGHDAVANDIIVLDGSDAIRQFKAIRATADATLKVTYFRN